MMDATQHYTAEVYQVVTRCGCGNPAEIHPDAPCPNPRAVEDNGLIGTTTWASDDVEDEG